MSLPLIKIRRTGWFRPTVGISVTKVPLQDLARLWMPQAPSGSGQALKTVEEGKKWNIERIGDEWKRIRKFFIDEEMKTVAQDAMALFDTPESMQTVCAENEQVFVFDHLSDVLGILGSHQYEYFETKPLVIIAALFLNAGRLPSVREKIRSRVPVASVSNLLPSQVANLFLDGKEIGIVGIDKIRKAILYCGGLSSDKKAEKDNRLIAILRHAETVAWENRNAATGEKGKTPKIESSDPLEIISETGREVSGETEAAECGSVPKPPAEKENPSEEEVGFDISDYFGSPEDLEMESSASKELLEVCSETADDKPEVPGSGGKTAFISRIELEEPDETLLEEPENCFFFRLNEYQLAVNLGAIVSGSHLSCFMFEGFVYAEEEKMALVLNEIRKKNGLSEIDYEEMEGYLEPLLCCIRKETCLVQMNDRKSISFQESYYVFNARYFGIPPTDPPSLPRNIGIKKIKILRKEKAEIPLCFENADNLQVEVPPDSVDAGLAIPSVPVDDIDTIAMTVFDTDPDREDQLVKEVREKDILGRIGSRIDKNEKECFCYQDTVFVVREVIVDILNEIRKERGLKEFNITSGQDYLFGVLQTIEFKQWQIFFTSAKYSRPIKRYFYTFHKRHLGTDFSADDHPWIKKAKLVSQKEEKVF